MADVPPFIIDKPSLKILAAVAPDTVPVAEIELQCSGRGLDVTVDQDENELTTFCGTYTNYGQEKWTVTLNAYTSFGTDGFWTLLRPCVGHIITFELLPQGDAPVSVDNPVMTGKAMVKAFPFLSGDQGNGSEVDVDLKVQGMPEFLDTAPANGQAQTTTTSSKTSEPAAA
jgi:hypothetical protein